MKRLFLSLLTLLAGSSLFAQEKVLNVQETTEGIGVYPCGDRHEAMVQFITSEPFGLEFLSSHDNDLEITLDSVAGKKTYSIVFITQAPGMDYSGRRLTIKAEGFQDYRLPLPLQDKQKFEYTVSDPYSKLRSPFFLYMEKAQEDFRDGNYQMAKDSYELCRYCPEFATDSINVINHITICDSMMTWSNQALQAENFHRYTKASEYYSKMLNYNSSDFIRTQLFAAQQGFINDCQALSNMGQTYFAQDNYERAQEMYEQIVENGCNDLSQEAATMLSAIRKAKMRRDDHARTLMLAYSPNMWGLSWGNYYRSRSHGWYGTFMTNSQAVDLLAMRSFPKGEVKDVTGVTPEYDVSVTDVDGSIHEIKFDYDESYKSEKEKNKGNWYPADNKFDYEVNFAVGCSWHIWEPIFVHFGLGYHGGGFDTFSGSNFKKAVEEKPGDGFKLTDQATWTSKFKYDYSQINWFHGAAPEIGIVLKYWRASVKFTYQYSYWINGIDEYEDFLKANTNNYMLGVGFCW